MSQEDDGGRQLNHPEEVVGITLRPRHDAAETMKPGEEPLDFPAPTFTAERPAILSFRAANRVVRSALRALPRRCTYWITDLADVPQRITKASLAPVTG